VVFGGAGLVDGGLGRCVVTGGRVVGGEVVVARTVLVGGSVVAGCVATVTIAAGSAATEGRLVEVVWSEKIADTSAPPAPRQIIPRTSAPMAAARLSSRKRGIGPRSSATIARPTMVTPSPISSHGDKPIASRTINALAHQGSRRNHAQYRRVTGCSTVLSGFGAPAGAASSSTQKLHPEGGAGQDGSGCHPAGGDHPGGGAGQLGGGLNR
jgi:hypothetical protein